MKKVAVITVGFGPEQSEVTETVSLLIALSELNANYKIFSLKLEPIFSEHPLHPLDSLNPNEFDALVIAGGVGNATLLSTWEKDKIKMDVHPAVEKAILAFHSQSKPIGAMCMAVLLIAKVLTKQRPHLTMGEHDGWAPILKSWNVELESCPSTDYITDRNTKVITTPAYSNDNVTPFQLFTGIRGLAKELVEMA